MKIYTALVSTDMAPISFVATTLDALNEQIHTYVRTYWHELGEDWHLENVRDMSDAVEIYFENHIPMELLYISEADLEGVTEIVPDAELLWSEFEVQYYGNQKFLDALSDKLDTLPEGELSYYVCEFNERSYDGDAGCDYLREILEELEMDPDDFEEDGDDDV